MKIRILTNCYPPEVGAAANQLYELAQALTAKGHKVTVVTRFPRYISREFLPAGLNGLITHEERPEARVTRIKIPELSRKVPLLRELEHLLNFILFIYASVIAGRPDVTLVYSPPIVVGYASIFARLFIGSKVILNVQDLFPQSFIDVGLIKNRFLIQVSRGLEKWLYKAADVITVMSEGNKTVVDKTSGNPGKVKVVYNWVDCDYIIPGLRNNRFRKEYGLDDKFVISFAGCMGEGQDLDIILESAKILKNYNNILFLMAGNGPKYDYVRQRALGMGNVKVVPIVPREKYVDLLAASDISLVTLSPLINTPVVPSKILSIMSSGRPLLASLPKISDAVNIIDKAKSGICIEAGDAGAFSAAILKLFNDQALREQYGKNGRAFVIDNYSLKACAAIYERIFSGSVGKGK